MRLQASSCRQTYILLHTELPNNFSAYAFLSVRLFVSLPSCVSASLCFVTEKYVRLHVLHLPTSNLDLRGSKARKDAGRMAE